MIRSRGKWLKQLRTKYGPAVGRYLLTAVLGGGLVWQWLNYQLGVVRAEKELYGELRAIQDEVSAALPNYVAMRDQHQFAKAAVDQDPSPTNQEKVYLLQNNLNALRARLANQAEQYNRIDVKLARLERRTPKWIVLPVPPPPITDLRAGQRADGTRYVVYAVPKRDRLLVEVDDDLDALIRREGLPARKTEPESLNVTLYGRSDSAGTWGRARELATKVVPSR